MPSSKARWSAEQVLESLERRLLFALPTLIAYGFEQPSVTPGGSVAATSGGWARVPGAGAGAAEILRPSPGQFSSVAPLATPAEGQQVGRLGDPGVAIERFFGRIEAATRYSLSFAVGDALAASFGDWAVELWAGQGRGTVQLARLGRDDAAAAQPSDGGWMANHLSVDSTSFAPVVGQGLFVRLVNASAANAGAVYFDNLRLTNDPPVLLNATDTTVEIGNPSQKIVFAKDGSGRFQYASFVREADAWSPLFDSGLPLIQGANFDIRPTAYTVTQNTSTAVAVRFTGTHPTRGYAYTLDVDARGGSDLIHFAFNASPTVSLSLSGLEPQAAFFANQASAPVMIGQGPGNIYNGAPENEWGNSFPAGYFWSGGKEAAVFFDLTPSTWMSSQNLRRFKDVRANAFSQSGKLGLGLQVVRRTGNLIPAGTSVKFDFSLYARSRPVQPSRVAAVDAMVRAFEPLHASTAAWPTNNLNPSQTNWTYFAQQLSANLMLDGIVTDDWNFTATPATGSRSFEDVLLANDGTSPLTNYGWTRLAGYGSAIPSAWRPASSVTDFVSVNPLASPAAGQHAAFINEPGGGAEMPLGVIQANTPYAVTVAIGNRFAEGEGDWSLQLWAGSATGGTFLNQTFADQAGVSHPIAGRWADNTVTFNSASNPGVVGQNLFIRITNYAGTRSGTIFFDNVRVTGALGPVSGPAPWRDTPMFSETQVNTLRVSSDYAVGTGLSNHPNVLDFWDFSTANNYLAPWVAFDRLNPDPTRNAFIDLKVSNLPLFFDPQAGMIRWGTRYPTRIGDFEMSWQNFTFNLETIKNYRMLAPADFNPAIAGRFLMSLQGLMTLAHNVNYNFPQWLNPYQKVAITQQDVPALGVIYEPWQAGTYAYLMLEGYKLTGLQLYVDEAKAAVNRVLETLTYSISNQVYSATYNSPADFPITEIFGNAWGIAACKLLADVTGDAKYDRYSDYFFDSLLRMSYWYESNLAADAVDLGLRTAGLFRNHGGAFTGSPWENIEAMLPMTIRLKLDARPREMMLKLFNLQRINSFLFNPAAMPAGAQTPPSVQNSPANYIPIEDYHTFEQGNINGSLGRCTYMSSGSFWNYLLYEAFGSASDRDVMVLNLDAVDSFEAAFTSTERNFIVYNPLSATRNFTLQMRSLASGSYDLLTTDSLGRTTAATYTAAQLVAGIPMTLATGEHARVRLRSTQHAAMSAAVGQGQGARDRISYAYQLLQATAVAQGVTPQLLSLKVVFQSAVSSYQAADYATATAQAQVIVTQLGGGGRRGDTGKVEPVLRTDPGRVTWPPADGAWDLIREVSGGEAVDPGL